MDQCVLNVLPIVTIIDSYIHNIFCFSQTQMYQLLSMATLKKSIAINLNESLLSKAEFYKQPVECNYMFIFCLVINTRVYHNDTAATGTRPQEDLSLRLWSGSLVMVPGVDSECYGLSQLVTLNVCPRKSLDVTFLDYRLRVCNCELKYRTFEP